MRRVYSLSDRLDLEFCEFLAVADAAAVTDFGFVFENAKFASPGLPQDTGHDFGSWYMRVADLGIFIRHQQHLVKNDLIALGGQLFYLDFIFGGNKILLPAGFNDCEHR